MIEIIQSETFRKWLLGLNDIRAKAKIEVRLNRIEDGNFGDVKPVGSGISEARIDYGAGYRLYFMQKGKFLIIMLAGGDKSTQSRDIKKAIEIAKQWNEQNS